MSEKTVRMTMLYDFFGELLTDKQKEYFDLYYNEDYSLSEIAENAGISRQGVRDILVRAENTLVQAEEKTGLMRRFSETQQLHGQIALLAQRIADGGAPENAQRDARDILALLSQWKG